MTRTEALELRSYIEKAAESLDDGDAVRAAKLFPVWAEGAAYTTGKRVQYGDRLYKCVQAHTSQSDWTPDAVPALWAVVDETHAGTQEDPIPAARGMEYEYGKYYSDSEDGKLYLCERTGEAAGGRITLQYMPHELVGNYFTEVTG